jgi:predicted O-linked N-acetylglucosamine transferase (SPINDLY family)
VGKILQSLLPQHDKSQFHVSVYSDGKKNDKITKTIKNSVESFRETRGMTDEELLNAIDADGIDILFDLGGFTSGGNRLRLLARRAAPVQISFLGYPNTSALPTIDFRLTDRFADLAGQTNQLFAEQPIFMDNGFLAWEPYDVVSEVKGKRQGPARIGTFNNVAKISESAIDCWARILLRTPQSKLVLKYGDRFGSETVCDRFRMHFGKRGILPSQLEFKRQAETLKGHLELMADVDLALDPFPYQGTMTSLESLSVGTPLVSLCGEYYAQRATSAMMMRLDLHELIASDQDEYVELAVQLLADLPALRELRPEIRDRFHTSELVNPKKFVNELEHHLLEIANARS